MCKKSILAWLLTASVLAMAKSDIAIKTIKPSPLPEFTVESLNNAKITKGTCKDIDKWPKLTPTWKNLKDADILIKFSKPAYLPHIGIVKLGWDWAVPKSIGISVNGQKEVLYELKSPRVAPISKIIKSSVIPLGSQPVKTLRIRVISIQSSYNKFGTLKVFLPKLTPTAINLPEKLPVNNCIMVQLKPLQKDLEKIFAGNIQLGN
jgi:hypothetical protein